MIIPKGNDRSWTKDIWKYMQRLSRCIKRAQIESGSLSRRLLDLAIYGRSMYTPEQLEIDSKRIEQLMKGLKPCRKRI